MPPGNCPTNTGEPKANCEKGKNKDFPICAISVACQVGRLLNRVAQPLEFHFSKCAALNYPVNDLAAPLNIIHSSLKFPAFPQALPFLTP